VSQKRELSRYKSCFFNTSFSIDVFANAANWYPWFFFDWIGGKRISVYCEVDQPSKKNYKCGNAVGGVPIGGYATNLGGKNKIVFCEGFFRVPNLDTIKQQLTQYTSRQNDVQWAKSTGHMFFHEMTHLSIIESRSPRKLTVKNTEEI
jgi:hypothetical protein